MLHRNQRVLCGEVSLVDFVCSEAFWDAGHEHPVFACRCGTHLGKPLVHLLADRVEIRALPDRRRLLAHPKEELVRLKAFLKIVTFMTDMRKEKLEGKTISSERHDEMWKPSVEACRKRRSRRREVFSESQRREKLSTETSVKRSSRG